MKNNFDKIKFGPWALITGASSGIGKEFAIQLAAKGINLVLVARRQTLLEELGIALSKKYGIAYHVLCVDLSTEQSFDEILKITNPLNIGLVISNAGTGAPGDFVHMMQHDLLKTVQTSVISHLKISHHFGAIMANKRSGGIILVSAMGAADGLPFMSNDAGTRAYIRSFGLGIHDELKRYNVNVTVLIVSPTDTPIVAHLGFDLNKMPMKPLTTEQCVREGLVALGKNRSTIIPGRMYRIMNTLIPASLSRKMFGQMLAAGNGIQLSVSSK